MLPLRVFPRNFACGWEKRIYVGTLEGKLVGLKLKTELDEEGATQVLKEFLDPEPENEDAHR